MARRPTARRHLLVVATNFAETHGGVESHLAHLLPRLAARGSRVTLIYLGSRSRRWAQDGVDVVSLRRRLDLRGVIGLPDPRDWRALVRDVRSLPNDSAVTHVATHTRFYPTSLLGVGLAHRLGVPAIHTEHGAGTVVTGSRIIEAGSSFVDRTLGRRVLRNADEVLAVSKATAVFVQRLAGRNATIFSNGIDVQSWLPHEVDAETDGDAGPAGGVRDLVFVGRLVEEKGWRVALDAAVAVREAYGVSPVLHIVGDGPDLGALGAQSARLGLSEVRTHGRLEASEIRDLLRGAVYINPSVAAEGFQLTQLEAAAAGAAVVTYDVGVARDLEEAEVADVSVVPAGDSSALSRAAVDAVVRPPVPPDAEALSQWDWDHLAGQYEQIIDQTTVKV